MKSALSIIFFIQLVFTAVIWVVAFFVKFRISRTAPESMKPFLLKMKWIDDDESHNPNFAWIKRLRLILSIYTLSSIAFALLIALTALKVSVLGEGESGELMLYSAGLIGLAGIYIGALWFMVHCTEKRLFDRFR